MIRKAILFVLAVFMIVGGSAVVYMKVFTPAPLRTWMAAGAAGMAWLGIYLLWDDFIRPLVRRDSGPSS